MRNMSNPAYLIFNLRTARDRWYLPTGYSPPNLLHQQESRASKNSIPYLKEICAPPIKNEEIFAGFGSAPVARVRRWPHEIRLALSNSVLVRMFVKVGSDFNQKAPHFIQVPIFGGGCLGATHLGRRAKRTKGWFCKDLPRSAWREWKRAVLNQEVRLKKLENPLRG